MTILLNRLDQYYRAYGASQVSVEGGQFSYGQFSQLQFAQFQFGLRVSDANKTNTSSHVLTQGKSNICLRTCMPAQIKRPRIWHDI